MSKLSRARMALLAGLPLVVLLTTSVSATETRNEAALRRVGEEIRFLAADEMEGRGPGTAGLEKAAAYIRDEYKRLGLTSGVEDGSYYQPLPLSLGLRAVAADNRLMIRGPDGAEWSLALGDDYQPAGAAGTAEGELVFATYGISAPDLGYDDYADLDVKNKIVVLIRREPQQGSEKSPFAGTQTSAHAYIRSKVARAKENGALAIIMVNDPYSLRDGGKDSLSGAGSFATTTRDVPFVHMTIARFDALLDATPVTTADGTPLKSTAAIETYVDESLKTVSQPLPGWKAKIDCQLKRKETEVVNVVGVMEGKGPHADETIIIGAHYDHLGYGGPGSRSPGSTEVHNGADDNATGTSALLELARRFAEREQPPARRLVFIAFTAEERGLIGSRFYTEHPLFPLENTVAMVNFDMIGQIRNDELLVYGTGTAEAFDALVEPAAAGTGLTVKKTPGVMAASDHWPFYQKKVPSLHVFSGLTQQYHTPADDFETINVLGVVQTIDFTEKFLDGICGLSTTPRFAETQRQQRPRRGVPDLGFVPNYASDAMEIRVQRVNDDSSAAKAGLAAGDVILKVGDADVSNLRDMIRAFRELDEGAAFTLTVRRGEKTLKLDIKP